MAFVGAWGGDPFPAWQFEVRFHKEHDMGRFWMVIFLVLWSGSSARAEARDLAGRGSAQYFVISIQGKDVHTDLGERNGVRPGVVVEVYRETEQVVHPVTGEVMGDAPLVIGRLKIIRVLEKYSIGKVVKWDAKQKVKRLDRVWFLPGAGEKPAGVERSSGRVSKTRLVVPGMYQLGQGQGIKAVFFLSGVFGFAGGGVYYRWKSNDAHQDYLDLPEGTPPADFDAAFDRYRKRARRGDAMLAAAAGIYLLNLIDGLLWDQAPSRVHLSGHLYQASEKAHFFLTVPF